MADEIASFAESLISGKILRAGDKRFRIVECEGYVYSESHPDLFTHCNEMQKTAGKFYFHRSTTLARGKYKSGTFKGVDVTFSSDESEYAGMLIRSVACLSGGGGVIEGPCRVVNAVLRALGARTIDEVVSCDDVDSAVLDVSDPEGGVWLEDGELPQVAILRGPRVGLTYKSKDPGLADEYIFRNYRFGVSGEIKNKWGFVVANPELEWTRAAERRYLEWKSLDCDSAGYREWDVSSIRSKCAQYGAHEREREKKCEVESVEDAAHVSDVVE
jgi:hypothetical protein